METGREWNSVKVDGSLNFNKFTRFELCGIRILGTKLCHTRIVNSL